MHEIVKSQDYDRYITTLFTPLSCRDDVFTVIRFNFEIKKILKIISDPMIGMIRFAWWREGVEEAFNLDKKLRNHEILKAMRVLKEKYAMEPDNFYKIIDTREKELENLGFKDFAQFKSHINDSDVVLNRIICEIIGVQDATIINAAERFAFAYGIIEELRVALINFANNKFNMPEDVFTECGAQFESYGKEHFLENSKEAVEKLVNYVRYQLKEGRIMLEKVELKDKQKAACPLLLAKVTDFYAKHIEDNDYDIFGRPIFNDLSPLQIIRLSLANFFGKY